MTDRTLDEAMGMTRDEIAQLRAKVENTGVTQTILAGHAHGVPGNCLQAALATVLRRPLDAVPHAMPPPDVRVIGMRWYHR